MEEFQPIIVKKSVKKHDHHGGSWKVAFADFAVAMMAFFFLLWILNSTNETQKKAIEGYFKDPAGVSESGGSRYVIDLGGSPQTLDANNETRGYDSDYIDPQGVMSAADIETLAEKIERERLKDLMQELSKKIEESETLRPFKNQLVLDITKEGLRIQVIDQTKRPMFDPGGARLKYYTRDILLELGAFLSQVPNKIKLTGHTDSAKYADDDDFGNWELSSDRANAARRTLVEGGMPGAKVAEVVGLADTVLFDDKRPFDPVNRRIAMIVLNKKAADQIRTNAGGAAQEKDQTKVIEPVRPRSQPFTKSEMQQATKQISDDLGNIEPDDLPSPDRFKEAEDNEQIWNLDDF
ncbi:flagellar motor protein MotB [Litoribrevibacter euphylliae]|uniref:Flagellar motor protein MotB n=1 Tax=Litoribrevibacter euphylliae TaxID=1834034 RepID=A0ABV7HH60_9GAMM